MKRSPKILRVPSIPVITSTSISHPILKLVQIVAICFAAFSGVANAQEFRGSISGRVIDQSTASVPSARVTFLSAATNASTVVVTDYDGNYALPYVTAGTYDVTVEA